MVSSSGPGPALLAGTTRDIPALRALLLAIPAETHGRVLIEAQAAVQIRALPAHPGISVIWLLRDEARWSVRPGDRLAQAVTAWLSEWQISPDSPAMLWLGARELPVVDRLAHALALRPGIASVSECGACSCPHPQDVPPYDANPAPHPSPKEFP